MKIFKIVSLVVLVLMMSSATLLLADELNDGQKVLVDKMIKAINADDWEALMKTLLPVSREGMNKENQAYFSDRYDRRLILTIPDTVELSIKVIDPREAAFYKKEGGYLNWPTVPTHRLELGWLEGPTKAVSKGWLIIEQDGQWFECVGIPSQKALDRFKAKMEKEALKQ